MKISVYLKSAKLKRARLPRNIIEHVNNRAKGNHVDAQFNLGWLYQNGYSLKQSDLHRNTKKAKKWHKKAARKNHPGAQFSLGLIYQSVDNNRKTLKLKALKLFEKAAAQGHGGAQYQLALMHRIINKTPNYQEMQKWFGKAADQGHARSLFSLGEMFENGDGVKQDHSQAFKLYHQAAEDQNLASAQFKGRRSKPSLSPVQSWILLQKWLWR